MTKTKTLPLATALVCAAVLLAPYPRWTCRGFVIPSSHLVRTAHSAVSKHLFLRFALAGSSTSRLDTEPRLPTTTSGNDNDKALSLSWSVTKPQQAATSSVYWSQLSPKLWEDPRREGVDVRVSWTKNDRDARRVAAAFVDRIEEQQQQRQHAAPLSHRTELEDELSSWIQCFHEVCSNSLQAKAGNDWDMLTARIVASRGPAAAKCPRWHLDHVPLRWIQSLEGPGCKWVDPNSSSALSLQPLFQTEDNENGDDDNDDTEWESTDTANAQRVDPKDRSALRQAAPGEAVILLGNAWKDAATKHCDLPPVLHKSPDGIPPWQGRVLLTMDVVWDE